MCVCVGGGGGQGGRGGIKVYLKSSISKKEGGTNLSETRLSEAVSTNLSNNLVH